MDAPNPAAAAAVTTGMEFSIALADLGNPAPGSAMINNGDHNYLSNQILAGLLPAPLGNLGGDGAGGFTGNVSGVDFNQFAGNQFFTVVIPREGEGAVPEPGTWIACLTLAPLAAVVHRRRRRGA